MMDCGRATLRILVFIVLISALRGFCSDNPQINQPAATLDTAGLLPNQSDLTFTTVAFLADTTIEVIACPTVLRANCPFSVFHWEKGVLSHIVETSEIGTPVRTSSVDGKRLLFDFNDRQVSGPQHALDTMRAVWTLGMIYPEEVNREAVQVVDTATLKACFDWRYTFPMTGSRRKSAAISPSGEFVAIKVENSLMVYQLPSVCGGPRLRRRPR
jgi:hypothetical protein